MTHRLDQQNAAHLNGVASNPVSRILSADRTGATPLTALYGPHRVMSEALLVGERLPRAREEEYLRLVAERKLPPIIFVTGASESVTDAVATLRGVNNVVVMNTSLSRERFRGVLPREEVIQQTIFSFETGSGKRRETRGIILSELIVGLGIGRDAVVIPIGHPHNIPAAFEAVRTHFPLAPVGSIVVRQSLRPSAESGPRSENEDSLRLVFNAEEVVFRRDAAHSRGIDAESMELQAAFGRLCATALDDACALAERVLTPYRIEVGNRFIPPQVVQSLTERLLPIAARHSIELVLKGGFAAAAMMTPASRPVSMDVDFGVRLPRSEFEKVLDMSREFSDTGEIAIQGHPGESRSDRSTKVSGKTGDVEFDAVIVRRVRQSTEGKNWVLEFKLGRFEDTISGVVVLPSGQRVAVTSVEMATAEKLAAGRGIEQGKFDLFDAAGFIATKRLDYAQFQRIIHRQRFKPSLDPADALEPITYEKLRSRLTQLGIAHPRLQVHVAAAVMRIHERSGKPLKPKTELNELLRPDVLKQLSMMDALLDGLDGIDRMIAGDAALPDDYRVKDRWGEEVLRAGMHQLRTMLYGLVETETLRPEAYVRRSDKSPGRSALVRGLAEGLD